MPRPLTSHIFVRLKSVVSQHRFPAIRPRNAPKYDLIKYDPYGCAMAKVKSSHVIVLLKSMVTKHRFTAVRPRQGDKLERVEFDPLVQKNVLYREVKKIKGTKV